MQRDGRFLGWIPSTSTNLIVVERALAGHTENEHIVSDPYFWCCDCRERHEEQEKKERYKKHMEENVRRINKMCHSNIDIGTLEQWGIEAQLKGLSVEEELAFFKEKINQLRCN